MDERPDRVTELFLRARDLAPGEREELFARECGQDQDLRFEVQARLAAERRPTGIPSEVIERLARRRASHERYHKREELARGGQGAILRVWDEDLHRELAMKVVRPKRLAPTAKTPTRALARFLEEAQITGQLDHPGVVPVHELGIDAKGRFYFTMKLVKGQTFERVLEHVQTGHDGWTRVRALSALLRACEAVAYAHAKHTIHRDLKPRNVMVGHYGETYVMDWGFAKVLDPDDFRSARVSAGHTTRAIQTDRVGEYTVRGDVLGTPAYMSPEQAAGHPEDVGPATDVYALGAILYHLLAGHRPYGSVGSRMTAVATLARLRSGPPEPLASVAPDAPAPLVEICEKAMERDPWNRHDGVAELADELKAYLEGRVRAAPEGALPELAGWARRHRGWAVGLAALGLGLLAAAIAGLAG